MAPITRSAKKQRLSPSVIAPIHAIPKVVLMVCMEYIGEGNFMFVGAVSKEFRECYIKLYSDCETSPRGFASDSLKCAKMCIENENEDFNRNMFRWAAKKGHSGIVKYSINHCSIPRDVFYRRNTYRTIGRRWEVLKLLKKHSFHVNWLYCCYGAAKARNKELVMWIIDSEKRYEFRCNFIGERFNNFQCEICALAADKKDIDTLKWFRGQGFEWNDGFELAQFLLF